MKRFFIGILCIGSVLAAYSCRNKNADDPNHVPQTLINIPVTADGKTTGKLPKMVFADTTHDFGDITAGDKVGCTFHFKNAGEADLIITNASASCGCTKPFFPEGVKHPGDTGTISVTFDSSNKQGKVMKIVTVNTNGQPPFKFLTITANIKPSNN